MTSIGEATTPSAGLEPEELIECEKCPDKFPWDELDEDGYCKGCVEGNRDYEERYRYFHSISR